MRLVGVKDGDGPLDLPDEPIGFRSELTVWGTIATPRALAARGVAIPA